MVSKSFNLALIQPKFEYVMPYRLTPLALSVLGTLSDKFANVDLIDLNYQKIPKKKYDLVGISCTSFTSTSAYATADRFRKKGIKVVLGGIHPTFCKNEALSHADTIVTGEAEEIWPKVLEDFSKGKLKREYNGGTIDMKNFPIVGKKYRQKKEAFFVSMPLLVQATRGCPNGCDFCTVSKFSGKKIRHRPIEDVVREIRVNNAESVFFVDDNLVADMKYAEELFRALIPLKIRWGAQVPLHFAKNENLVRLAKKSGCKRLFVGIESINQDSINEVSRKCRVDDYLRQINILKNNKIIVWAGFIFGFDHDKLEDISKTVDFCLENKIDFVNFHPLAAFPGTRLYEKTKDRLKYGYVVKPKNMDIDEMMMEISKGYKRFYTWHRVVPRFIGYKPLSMLKSIYLSKGYYNSA